MGKRKHKDSDDRIRRKIRRLEKKLRRSSSEQLRNSHEDRDKEVNPCSPMSSHTSADAEDLADQPYPLEENLMLDTEVYQTPTTTPTPDEQPATPAVPQEILDILGVAKTVDQKLGEKVPNEVSERWGKILVDGLGKEQKDSLMEKILNPENFLLARAPKINPEVTAVLTETAKNRDKRLEKFQNQLGCGIAGLVNLTKELIHTDLPKIDILRKISEVSQILLDLHYEDTVNRRKLIIPMLDKKFWNTIQGVKRDTFLFGEKLGENIKNSKDIEKSGQQIKRPFFAHPTNQQRNTAPSGNLRAPLRPTNSMKIVPTTRYSNVRAAPEPKRTMPSQQRVRRVPFNRPNEQRRR